MCVNTSQFLLHFNWRGGLWFMNINENYIKTWSRVEFMSDTDPLFFRIDGTRGMII